MHLNEKIGSFGFELEFFIVDKAGFPVIGSNKLIQDRCLEFRFRNKCYYRIK